MKKILVVTALALVMVWGVGVQRAAAGYMDDVSFFAVDDISDPVGGNGSVTLTNLMINYYGTDPATLEYSVDQSNWFVAGDSFTVNPVSGGVEQVYLRLNCGTDMVTSGVITFLSPEGDLFNGLKVDWSNQIDMTITIADNDDNVAPVPIPAAVWLLGSGLFGLIGVRRRSMEKV